MTRLAFSWVKESVTHVRSLKIFRLAILGTEEIITAFQVLGTYGHCRLYANDGDG